MEENIKQADDVRKSPVEIADGIYLVGTTNKKGEIECNPYLIIDNDEAVLIDPGSVLDFTQVFENVSSLVSPDKVKLIVAHHQDPDLCSSIPLFYRNGITPPVALHWRTSVLIRCYGISNQLYVVNENQWSWKFSSGRILRFIPAPYCHFAGSIMTYDEKTRTVFSGDLFGTLVFPDHIYADESYKDGMYAFHEHYMPSHEVLMPVMDSLLRIPVERIAPQHGCIIKDNIESFIAGLRQLECGSFSTAVSGRPLLPQTTEPQTAVLNEILERMAALFSAERVCSLFRNSAFELEDGTARLIKVKAGAGDKNVIDLFLQTILDRDGIRWVTVIEPFIRLRIQQYNLPLPSIFPPVEEKRTAEKSSEELKAPEDSTDIVLYDTLTGLFNKTVFQKFMEILLEQDKQIPFSVIYFSLNSKMANSAAVFKSFVYILKDTAEKVSQFRVFRLEENFFACIAENADKKKTQEILEKMRQAVKNSGFFIKETGIAAAMLYSSRIREMQGVVTVSYIDMVLRNMIEKAKKKGPEGICDTFEKEQLEPLKKQICILEPDATYIRFIQPHFQEKDYELQVYTEGLKLSAAIEEFLPDLFIAEAMSPQFSGFELREKLLRMPRGQTKPFILVSHRKDEVYIRRAAELGILFFLKKPFSREELFGLVDNLLR